MVLPFAGPLAETDHVLGHELVHAFQFDITGQDGAGTGGVPGALRLPLWFIEGMAEYLSVGPVDPHTAMWMRDAAKREKLPTISELDNPRYFPYRYGQAFWAYVGGRCGDHVIGDILKIAGRRGDAENGHRGGAGGQDRRPLQGLAQGAAGGLRAPDGHQDSSGQRLRPRAHHRRARRRRPEHRAQAEPGRPADRLPLRAGPVRDRACTWPTRSTGEVTRTIVKTAVDPHFESLQFINSAGAWDPAGRRFVFGAIVTRPARAVHPGRGPRPDRCARSRCATWARCRTRPGPRTAATWPSPRSPAGSPTSTSTTSRRDRSGA